MNTTLFSLTLLMGLTGSLHCAGMCGPIVYIMPFQKFSPSKKIIAVLIYHISRVLAYIFLGVVLYQFKSIFKPEVQQLVSIILGTFLILIALSTFAKSRIRLKLPWQIWVKNQISNLVGSTELYKIGALGFLNGLLPCGLVYMALMASLASNNIFDNIIAISFFGVGTLPMMISISLFKARLPQSFILKVNKFVPLILLIIGCATFARGLNLGIPYISPKIEIKNNEIKGHCCSPKK